MLLQNLINTATTDLDLEEKIVISELLTFIERFATKEFGDKEDNYFKKIIKLFNEHELIKTRFKYTCNDYLKTESASTFDSCCVYCGNKINVNTSINKHEITLIYSFYKRKIHKLYLELLEMNMKNMLDNYLIEGYKVILDELISVKDKVIPFIGSGVSTPFNLPNWGDMLRDFKVDHLPQSRWDYYEDLINEGDYLEALSLLKKSSYSLDTDESIQEKIQEIFEENLNLDIVAEKHNYFDLLKMNSNFYLTTNYDYIFTALRSKDKFVPPLVWSEIENLQKFMISNKGSMIHLHGVIHKPSTMIVTKENYENLYQKSDFKRMLSNFMANRFLMFIGFSFNDNFFVDLFKDILGEINGKHFILAPNIDRPKARELSQLGLKVIGLNIKKDDGKLNKEDLVLGIRCVLQYIATQ